MTSAPALAMASSAGMRPVDWKAYKQAAALPFEVLDCQVEVEKTVEGNRGDHRIDVWIQAEKYGVRTRWIIDCRHWDTPVTKADVVALRQVMKDVKGDRALMLSNSGFDSGATKAARSTSITLTTLEAIQETAELELTRTTLISLENRIIKLKQSLERLSESVQVAPGLWQSRPKPGVDADWVAKTTEQLEAIKFGFAKARLQQPPYFVQKDETSGQPLLVQTIEEFVSQAALLIETAESKLKQQHRQITQARLEAPAVEPAIAEAAGSEEAQSSEEAKPKRSLHAAFFRRKVSTPPVNFAGKEDASGGSRRERPGREGSDRKPSRSGKPGRASAGRDSRKSTFKGRKDSDRSFRPGPNEMGPLRAKAGRSRFEGQRDAPEFNYSPTPSPRPASGEKPKLAEDRFSASAAPGSKSRMEQRQGRDSKPQQDRHEPQFKPAESTEPSMEGRWWDEPEPRRSSSPGPQQRSGGGGRSPRPRPSHGGKPRLGGKKFAGGSSSSKKFVPRPALRTGNSGDGDSRPDVVYAGGERHRQARRFGGRPSGGKFGDRKFGGQKFSGQKFGRPKFSGGRSSRMGLQSDGFRSGKFGNRKAVVGNRSAVAKPQLRRQSVAEPARQSVSEGESS